MLRQKTEEGREKEEPPVGKERHDRGRALKRHAAEAPGERKENRHDRSESRPEDGVARKRYGPVGRKENDRHAAKRNDGPGEKDVDVPVGGAQTVGDQAAGERAGAENAVAERCHGFGRTLDLMKKETSPFGRSAFGHVGGGRQNAAEDDEARHAAFDLRLFRGGLLEFFGDGKVVLRAKEHQKKNRAGENEIPKRRDGEARKDRGRNRARDDAHVVARVNDVHRRLLPAALDLDTRHVHRDVEKPEAESHKGRGDGEKRNLICEARNEESKKEDDGARQTHGLDAEAAHEVCGARKPHHGGGAEREEDEPELVRRGARLFLERRNAGGEETVGKARSGKEEKSGETRLSVGEGLHGKRLKRNDLHCSRFAKNSLPERERLKRGKGAERCIMRILPKKYGISSHGRFGRI